MAKYTFYYFLAGVFIALGFFDAFAADISWKNISAEYTGINCVLINPDNPREIYAGSGKAVLKSEDSGNNWRVVLNVKKPVNYLVYGQGGTIYVASGRGLYYSGNQGRNWKLIFKISDYPCNEAVFVLVNSNAIYLGTKNGLFISMDKGRSWHKGAGKLSDSRVFCIARGPKSARSIYIACESGFFLSVDNGEFWEKIFNQDYRQENEDTASDNDEDEQESLAADINYIITVPGNSDYVYLSGKKGIYKSVGRGRQWESLPDFGLLDRRIKFMLAGADSILYTVTKTGIYKFTGSRWQELSLGLISQDIRSIALDIKGNLYAACDKGVFKAVEEKFPVVKNNAVSFYYKGEPDISQIQKAAIKYAEVEPEKIQAWRKQAAKKAFFPKISASVDRDTSDLWHWESGSTTKTDDDILIRGNDSIGWGVTVSWDLAEIIWNNDQTSIDTRSRLMVQLREDILDEVTKVYFERVRLKMELDNLSIEDRKKRVEKELKIEELTAMLDGLTDGYFSKGRALALNEGSI